MKPNIILIGLLLMTYLLTGCGGGSNAIQPSGELRVVHASPDAPLVDIVLTKAAAQGVEPAVDDLDYRESTAFLTLDTGTYDITVQAVTPSGNLDVISVPGFELTEDSRTTVIAVGTADAADSFDLEALAVAEPATDPTTGEVALRVIHGSTVAGLVDVYVTAPGTDVTTVSPTFTFDYKDDVDASVAVGVLPVGSYQIQITPAGDDSQVVYDSGSIDLTSFSGQKVILVAIDSTNQISKDTSPVQLLAVSPASTLVLADTATQAGVKVAHLSPDAGAVDVTVDAAVAIPNFDYLAVAVTSGSDQSYVALDAGNHDLNVNAPTGSGSPVLGTPVAAALEAGKEYSVIALGRAGDSGATTFALATTQDNNRPVATQASVKVIHGAAAVGQVDVYVSAASTLSVASIESGGATPLVPNFDFAGVTDYVAVTPGNYDIRVLDKSSGLVVINVEDQAFNPGDVITAIAHGPDELAPFNTLTPGLVLLTN